MKDNIIIFGNIFVFLLELLLNIKQIIKLYKAAYTPFIQGIHKDKQDFTKMKDYNNSKLFFKSFYSVFELFKLYFMIKYSVLEKLFFKVNIKDYTLKQVVIFAYFQNLNILLSQPFELYSTFKIEQKYGFNKMTLGLFFNDLIKTTVVTNVFVLPVIYIVISLIIRFTDFYLIVFLITSAFQLVMMVAYPVYIQPLFNKFEDLEENELREKIVELAKKVGFEPTKILKMDGSTRSHHSNAYFVGLFKEKRIVLYDTLLQQTNDSEVLAILCHEFGHWYYNHIFQQLLLSFCTMFLMIFGLNLFIKSSKGPEIISIIYFSWLSSFAWPLIGLCFNCMIRKLEREADRYAVGMGYGNELKAGLVKIHAENMSNLCTDEYYSAYNHSHPTLTERIELIDKEMKKNQ